MRLYRQKQNQIGTYHPPVNCQRTQLYRLYSSSKAAIVNFVQALSEEWQDSGIRINCINPERTKTPMRERNFGIEPEDTLLKSSVVASVSVNTIFSSLTGEVVDVKKRP